MALRGCRWIVAGLVLLGAGGCWDRIDINQLAVVLVLSIDRSPSGDIALGAQIVIPADSGIGGLTGGSGTTGARAVYTVNGVGRTLSAALGNVQSKVPRRLFLGNMQALALGEDYARNGISGILDVVSRTLQLRESINVVVTQGPALRLLQARPRLESFPGSELAGVLNQDLLPRVDVLQLTKLLHDGTGDAAVPWIEINTLTDVLSGSQTAQGGQEGTTQETDRPAQKEIYRIAGLGLFRGDRLTQFMSLHDARGLSWTQGDFGGATIDVDWPPPDDVEPALAPEAGVTPPGSGQAGTPAGPGGGQPARNVIVFRILRVTSAWRVQVHGDQVDATLRLTAEDDVQEDPGGVDITDLRLFPTLKRALSDRISGRVRSAFQLAQKADADIFQIGLQVAMQDPKAWSRLHARWSSEIYPHVSLHVTTQSHIRRLGFVETPLPHQLWQMQR